MSNIFTVTPMSQRFSLEAGKTYTGSIKIVNPADATDNFNYKVAVSPYGVVSEPGKDYTIDFKSPTRTQIAEWITITEPTGTIEPNGVKTVEFTINVPENAPAGGQYAAITISSNDKSEPGQGVAVKNVFEMASIIYGTVQGETKHDAEIISNNVPAFSTSAPIVVSAELKNGGNIHEDATFVITVSNVFTGEKILPTEQNDGHYSELLMPESERFITREISNLPMLGVIRVSQTIYLNGKNSEVTKDVLICPIWFMGLVLLTIASIIATIVVRIKKRRSKIKF